MNLCLKGKYALVTGGSHGIGRGIALALAEEGCSVAICSRDKEKVANAVKEIEEKGVKGLGISADVLSLTDIEKVMKAVIDLWGTIHILINNVGGGGRWGSDIVEDTPESVWQEVYGKNTLAATRFTMRAIPFMRKQKWGRVVTVASICGREGGGRPWFTISKSAEISLMKTLAMKKYLVRDGITFNSVCPGGIMIEDTGWDRLRKEKPKEFKEIEEQLPLGRLGAPEEVADVVAFICSEKARLVNGASVVVDGAESRSF